MLRDRFIDAWTRAGGVPGEPAAIAFAEVTAHWSEPHRRYHTPEHLRHCLDEFDRVRDSLADPAVVELVMWYHDAVWRAGAADNEQRSVDLFRRHWQGDPGVAERVEKLIMATRHAATPAPGDESFVVDIDLSGFGLPWDAFRRESDTVRAEYPHLDDADFYARHLAFLNSLLARPSFYFTDVYRSRSEQQARANVERLVNELAARGFLAAEG